MGKPQSTFKTDNGVQQYAIQWLCGGLSAFVVGGFSAWWLVPMAYEQRGYWAVGGEWIAVLFAALAAFEACKWILKHVK